ncbi:transcriptional regulator [Alphaproteobacteria bacterium]|nr:transcriptional regulator [Alphaproteobacteria bacterium]GHS98556.1 transcriptional regulator [Alphaproteobacteria bacterium]
MNKHECIAAVAEKTGLKKNETEKTLEAFFDTIETSLKQGEPVCFVGFGNFERVEHKAKTGRNPRTGQALQISAKKCPKFKPGKSLREACQA